MNAQVATLNTPNDSFRAEILAAIEDLRIEFEERRVRERDMPSCVAKAYEAALEAHYELLDEVAG